MRITKQQYEDLAPEQKEGYREVWEYHRCRSKSKWMAVLPSNHSCSSFEQWSAWVKADDPYAETRQVYEQTTPEPAEESVEEADIYLKAMQYYHDWLTHENDSRTIEQAIVDFAQTQLQAANAEIAALKEALIKVRGMTYPLIPSTYKKIHEYVLTIVPYEPQPPITNQP